MQFKPFTAQEAAKIIMDKLKQKGLGMFVAMETVQDVVNDMYNEGEFLSGTERSPYVGKNRTQESA